MQRCDEVTRAFAREEMRGAPLRKRLSVRIHLLMCRACRRYVRELDAIGEAVRQEATAAPLSTARVEALVQEVTAERPDSDRNSL
jgi:predicted anti-sigma-YlaC factor YlaD